MSDEYLDGPIPCGVCIHCIEGTPEKCLGMKREIHRLKRMVERKQATLLLREETIRNSQSFVEYLIASLRMYKEAALEGDRLMREALSAIEELRVELEKIITNNKR